MNILHQYLPGQYGKIQAGELKAKPRELAKAGVMAFVEDYEYAAYGV